MKLLLAVMALALVAGCEDPRAKLVGTWKAQPIKTNTSGTLPDLLQTGALGLASKGMTVEFNRDGRFKLTMMMASAKGSYEVRGDTITLIFEPNSPTKSLKLKFGAKPNTLELAREFDSDPTMTFEKL